VTRVPGRYQKCSLKRALRTLELQYVSIYHAVLALLSLLTVYSRRGGPGLTRRDLRRFVNRLSIAWLALGEILGSSRD